MNEICKRHILGVAGLAVTLSTLSVGCASRGWLAPTNLDGQYHTVTLPEGYNGQYPEFAVLVGRSARIEEAKLVYGCFYQTQKGVVRVTQSYECESRRKL